MRSFGAVADPRLRRVAWRDLTELTDRESLVELLRPMPWLIGSLVAARFGWFPIALGLSFFFFLAGLRQVHDAFHHNLGLERRTNHLLLTSLSVLMLGSMHAVRVTHLHHHKHALAEEDVEASSARLRWWQALILGPLFPVRLHAAAIRIGKRNDQLWIAFELAITAAMTWAAVSTGSQVLGYHVAAMAAGQCGTAFFAVWTVHHGCDSSTYIARTLRHRLKSALVMDMFFHVEHHLFPKVPTRNLHALAERLDRAAPDLCELRVY